MKGYATSIIIHFNSVLAVQCARSCDKQSRFLILIGCKIIQHNKREVGCTICFRPFKHVKLEAKAICLPDNHQLYYRGLYSLSLNDTSTLFRVARTATRPNGLAQVCIPSNGTTTATSATESNVIFTVRATCRLSDVREIIKQCNTCRTISSMSLSARDDALFHRKNVIYCD